MDGYCDLKVTPAQRRENLLLCIIEVTSTAGSSAKCEGSNFKIHHRKLSVTPHSNCVTYVRTPSYIDTDGTLTTRLKKLFPKHKPFFYSLFLTDLPYYSACFRSSHFLI